MESHALDTFRDGTGDRVQSGYMDHVETGYGLAH